MGIKGAYEMNVYLLTKLGWRLLEEKESLWAKVLTSKYINGEVHLTKLIKNPHASNAWQGIATVAPLLLKGVRIRIKYAHNTLF